MRPCPVCEGELYHHVETGRLTCRNCGAAATVNPQSGHTIWMRAGKVVLAEQDVADAIRRAAHEYPDSFAAKAETDSVVAAALKD
jgi:hypothetical protein